MTHAADIITHRLLVAIGGTALGLSLWRAVAGDFGPTTWALCSIACATAAASVAFKPYQPQRPKR